MAAYVTVIVTKTPHNEPDMMRQVKKHGVVSQGQHGCERRAGPGRVATARGSLIAQRRQPYHGSHNMIMANTPSNAGCAGPATPFPGWA